MKIDGILTYYNLKILTVYPRPSSAIVKFSENSYLLSSIIAKEYPADSAFLTLVTKEHPPLFIRTNLVVDILRGVHAFNGSAIDKFPINLWPQGISLLYRILNVPKIGDTEWNCPILAKIRFKLLRTINA